MSAGVGAEQPVELAEEPDFALGSLRVSPSTCRVHGANDTRLEPRVMAVLVVLVQAGGRTVTRDELIGRCWDRRIVTDNAISRAILQLRALARSEPGAFELETVPKVGFRLHAAGSDAATANAASRPKAERRAPRILTIAGLLTLIVVAAGLGAWALRRFGAERAPVIAISAFEPMERDVETSAFAKRLNDDVAGVLNENVPGLAPPEPDGGSHAADLRVGGSAGRQGQVLRVRAFLEDGRARVTLWSHQYEAPAAEEARLRTQVAVDLSDILLTAMEPLQQKGLRMDPRAVALWLSATANYRQGRMGGGDPLVAVRAFQNVTDRAPEFARARGMLAQYLAFASENARGAEAADLERRARAEASRAIRSDPTTAEAGYDTFYWLARIKQPDDLAAGEAVWNWGLSRATGVPGGFMRRCELRLDLGRIRDALSDCARAAALRPLGAPWGYRYARALAASGQREEAERAFEREVRLHPQHWWVRQAQFDMWAFSRPPAQALALLHRPADPPTFTAEETDALDAFLRARASASPGDIDAAAAKLKAAANQGGLSQPRLFKALVTLGRLDDAMAVAPRASDLGSSQGWLFEPGMEPLRRDPRFWQIASRAGLIRYWRTRAAWPDFCAAADLGYDCRDAAKAVERR